MSDPYLGEIRMFGGNFAPRGWAFCAGQLLPIAENDALYALIGTTYGGDGQSTFGLPDLRGRIPVHQGGGFAQGEGGGSEQVTLTVQQMPTHTHPFGSSGGSANSRNPVPGNAPATSAGDVYVAVLDAVPLSPQAVTPAGGSQPLSNLQPSLCVNFIIALEGIFPSQS
jgi:microcystin-dependent protein